MAITRVASGVSTANTALKTATPTIAGTLSANAGEIIIVKATTGLATHVPSSLAFGGAAGAIVWGGPVTVNNAANSCPLVFWYGYVEAGFTNQTITLTCTITGSSSTTTGVFTWTRLVGIDPAASLPYGTSPAAITASPYSTTLTGVAAGSYISWLGADYNGVKVTGIAYPYGDAAEGNYINATAGTLTAIAGGQVSAAGGTVTSGYTATGTNTSVRLMWLTAAAAADISTLSTDFTAMPAFFNANYGGAFIDGNGQGQTPTVSSYAGFSTTGRYNLVGSSVYVQVVTASGTSGTRQNGLQLNVGTADSIEMMLDGGVFKGRLTKAGVNTDTTLGTYNATTHAWWRMREAAGTLYWDTSPDGTTWTNRGSAVHGMALGSVKVNLQAGYYGTETAPPNSVYDNFNYVPPAVISWSGDFTKTDAVAAGFQDANWNRDVGDGTAGTLPWPMPIAVAADGVRSLQVQLPSGGKRDEVLPNHRDLVAGDNVWFGSSFYLPTGFDTTANAGSGFQVIEQLRQADDTGSPVAAFEVRNGNLLLTGGYGVLGASPANQYQYSQTLVTGITTGVRHYMAYRVGPFSTTAGVATIDVYVDGAHVLTNFTIPPPSLIGGSTYQKQGWYRDPANTYAGYLYISHSKVGATQAAVDSTPAAVNWTQTVTDTAHAADSAGQAAQAAQAFTDTAGAADSSSYAVQAARTVTDTAGAADSTSQVYGGDVFAPGDAIGVADAGTSPVADYERGATDAIGVVDSLFQGLPASRDVFDEIGVDDDITVGHGLGYNVDTDSIGVDDSDLSYTLGDVSEADDAIGAADSVTQLVDYEPQLTDPAGAADSMAQVVDFQREVDDAFGVADSTTPVRGQYATPGDAIGVADSASAVVDHANPIIDTAGMVDSLSQVAPAARQLTDPGPVSDFVNVDIHGRITVAVDEADESDTAFDLPPGASMPVPVAIETSYAFGGTTQASNAASEVAETDSVWTPTPTGSYPTAEAAERDLGFTPIVLVDDGEFGVAISDADRVPVFVLKADWNRNGLYDHPLSDLTSLVTDISVDRSLSGTLPVEVGLVEGYASAALSVTLEGTWTPGSASVTVESPRVNLAPNPSAEINANGYSVVTTGTLSGVTVTTGTAVTPVAGTHYVTAKPTTAGTAGYAYLRCPNIPVTPGATYTFSAYRYPVGAVGQAYVGVDWLDASQNQLAGTLSGVGVTGAGWVRGSVSGAAPAGAAYARQFLVSGTIDPNNYVYWDAVLAEAGATLDAYFDGDAADCAWNGARQASSSTYYPPTPSQTAVADSDLDVVDVFAPYRPDSPLYGSPLLRTPIYLETGFVATDGPRLQRRFTGTVSQISPASAARSVKLAGLDASAGLRATLTVPGAGMFEHLMALYGPDVYRSKLNSQWLIDQALRANGIYASPPHRDDALLAVTGHGSQIPHVGWGGAPEEYYPQYRGQMWYPSYFGGALAGINGGSGRWWLTSQVTAAAGDGFGFSAWMAMYPAGVSGDHVNLSMDLTTNASWYFRFGTDTSGRPWVGMLQSGQTEIRATAYTYTAPANQDWEFVGVHVAFAATSMSATFRINGATYLGSATLPARAGNWKPGLFINYSWYGAVTNFQLWRGSTPPIAPWQGEDPNFVPQADLDPGTNLLTGIPELNAVDSWDLIKAVTDAEGSTFQFTEDGRPQFRSIAGDTYYGRTKTVKERITADRNLADLVATTDESTIRNVINTKTKTQLVSDWQEYYVSPDLDAFDVAASTTSYFNIQLPGAAYDIPPPLSTFGCTPDTPTCFDYAGGAGFIFFYGEPNYMAAHGTTDWSTTRSRLDLKQYIKCSISRSDNLTWVGSGVQIRVVRLDPWTMQVIINNQNTFGIRMATAATFATDGSVSSPGEPALVIPARIVSPGPEQIETQTDNGSVTLYGESSFDIGGSDENWRQTPDGFRGLASEVLATTSHPVPVLDAVDVPHDPRRALGDRIILEDPDGLGEVMASIVGLTQTFSTQGAMDKITVRPLAPPGLGLLDDATHGLLDSSLVLGP